MSTIYLMVYQSTMHFVKYWLYHFALNKFQITDTLYMMTFVCSWTYINECQQVEFSEELLHFVQISFLGEINSLSETNVITKCLKNYDSFNITTLFYPSLFCALQDHKLVHSCLATFNLHVKLILLTWLERVCQIQHNSSKITI